LCSVRLIIMMKNGCDLDAFASANALYNLCFMRAN